MSEAAPQNTVPVVDTNTGELTGVLPHDLSRALSTGFRQASPEEVHEFSQKQKFGTGLPNELKAAAAGAGRTASFGLSDQLLTKTGLVNPETLHSLEKYNPVATGIGEVAGIGGMLLAPELGAAGAAAKGAGAAEAGTSALSQLMNPVKVVSKIGQGVTEAAAPLAEKAAGVLANPETSPIVNKIISKAGSHAVGSAIEGAGYGLGQSISEEALGDPDLNAEKLLSNVGYSALFGGGVGALIGGVGAATSKAIPTARDALENAGFSAPNDFESTVRLGSGENKKSILEGLKELKPNVADINTAANELGVPTFAGQISNSDAVQKSWSMMSQSPTAYGVAEKQAIDSAVSKISGDVQQVFQPKGQTGTLAETGEKLQESISKKLSDQYTPIKNLYDQLKEVKADISISDLDRKALKDSLFEVIKENKLAPRSPGRQFIESLADGIDEMKTLADIQDYSQSFYKSAGFDSKFAAGAARANVENVVDGLIRNIAGRTADPLERQVVEGLTEQLGIAKGKYRTLVNEMQDLGDVLGKKVRGPEDFINFIKEAGPEKISEKLFQKKNSKFVDFFIKKFPEEWETIKDFQKNKILNARMSDGEFNLNGALKDINKMEPELRRALFDEAELRKLSAAKTYAESFPKNFNPSGTATGLGWMGFLKNPLDAAAQHVRDFGLKKGFESIVESNGGTSSIKTLGKLERTFQSTANSIKSASKAIFGSTPATVTGLNAYAHKDGDVNELMASIKHMDENPSKLLDALEASTDPLHPVAPSVSAALQMSAVRANAFLATKIPKSPNPKPLSTKFIASPAEISKFNRYFKTIQNPIHVLHGVKTGMITSEQMEALTTVYPRLLAAMQSSVMEQLTHHMSKGDNFSLPYKKKMALSMFLGQDLDNSLVQSSIASNQMAMMNMGKEQDRVDNNTAIKVSQTGLSNLSTSQRNYTPMQEIAAGGDA